MFFLWVAEKVNVPAAIIKTKRVPEKKLHSLAFSINLLLWKPLISIAQYLCLYRASASYKSWRNRTVFEKSVYNVYMLADDTYTTEETCSFQDVIFLKFVVPLEKYLNRLSAFQ